MDTNHVDEKVTPWAKVLGVGLGLAVLVGVILTAFAWPSSEVEPRELPIAVVGPPEAATQIEQQLDAAMPDGFDIEPASDPDAARRLIEDREVYGAVVASPDSPPQVLTASAASPAVARVLQGVADAMAREAGGSPGVQVDDVVAHPDDDARGSGFSASALPMVIGGMAVGYAMSFAVAGVWRKVGGALVGATGAGLVGALVAQPWLGILEGSYLANAGAITLTVAAISSTIVGLGSLLGHAGLALGALVMLLLGNPLSGVTSAPEMLPSGWGTLGQLLPPGAGGTLLRSTSFFDGAAAGGPILVLSTWAAVGLLLAAAGWALHERRTSRAATAGSTSQAVPAGS